MRFDPANNRIYVRQSWLGDALICPQRARYALGLPSMRRGSDATAIGTAVHAGIEQYLGGHVSDLDTFLGNILAYVSQEMDKDIKRTEISEDPEKMERCVTAMGTAWWTDIRPVVPMGGKIEHKFEAPTGMTASDGSEIWFEGTIDYVAPDGTLWDWKTSSRTYFGKEKQSQAHQPTVYVAASRRLGLIPDTPEPSLFRFGVMVRQVTPKSQIVTVQRGPEHIEWLTRQTRSVVDTALRSWGQPDWMMNDQHNLCSPKWCDYWTVCKGVHWHGDALELPDQQVPTP